ncbi:tetratricopeptide repeat protein, partial [Candidatus Pacearchaeota archaeon]|nr:tetratricopeptide repeat protein [Candidatus Pacearchaeota archaeon]
EAKSQEVLGEIMYFKAQKEIINGNYEEAIQFLGHAIEHNQSDGAAYNDRALCLIELDADEDQVLADFDKGIEVESDYATVYHNKGWYLNQLGVHDEAILYFEKTLKLEPNRAVTYENLADAYLNLGNKQKAIEAFQKAVEVLNLCYTDIKDQIEAKIKIITDSEQRG